MTLFAMEPAEADWYTQAGFWLSLAGVAVSTIGLAATYYQVRKARKSADAARDAAELTLRESQARFRSYLATTIYRQLSEVERFVSEAEWMPAKLRCEDIALVFAQLGQVELATNYRRFGNLFRDKLAKPDKKFVQIHWDKLIEQSNRKIDELISTFT